MSLETPEKIRNLQRKLYCKAKAEPAFRFYILYDKICREDVLWHAYALARANAGAPGVDGTTFEQIDASGVEAWLAGLREDLVSKTYRADPVRRATIPKPGGGERPLGIPMIRDRVVQTAVKIVLEPIFEADFRARRPTVPLCESVRGPRRTASTTRASWTAAVSLAMKSVGKPDALIGHVRLCVQRRLACSAGERPAGARIRGPVVWIAGWRETKTLKPIDNVSRGEATSHRAVTTVNAKVASKVSSPEGRAPNRRAKAAWGA